MLIKLYYIIKMRVNINNISLNFKYLKLILFFLYTSIYKFLLCILLKSNYFFLILKNNNFLNLFNFLKNTFFLNCSQLMDILVIDRLEMKLIKGKRFNYIYVILSLVYNIRIFISGFIGLFEILPSLINLYKSADWLEREIWDMFGIFFLGHINLRRILTDYGFIGFPLRKDFPLSGYIELRYDEIFKSIVLEPLELTQEFRFFKLEIPWKI